MTSMMRGGKNNPRCKCCNDDICDGFRTREKNEWKKDIEAMDNDIIDTSDYVTIKITKAKIDGEQFSWYLDVEGGEFDGSGGTAPSFDGIFDMAYSIIHGGDKHNWEVNEWVKFDANAK